jgi:hypothetical protein
MLSQNLRSVGALSAVVATLVAAPAVAETTGAEDAAVPRAAQDSVTAVSSRLIRPDRHSVSVHRFSPWASPSPAKVHRIIDAEAARWRAPAARLRCRIDGESRFRWDARNGQYAGVGQFAPSTLQRGVASIGSRRVTVERRRVVPRWVVRETRYSDGTARRVRSHRIRTVQVVRHVGVIPRHPAQTHAWAQIRVMARAMVGLGAVHDSEWGVRC